MKRNAIFGGVLWVAVAGLALLHLTHASAIELLLLLAPLAIVPLGLELCTSLLPSRETRALISGADYIQLPAALCAAISFLAGPGVVAALLVLPWLIFGCVLGAIALRNLFREGVNELATACLTASFLYLPIGCAWLMASRLGMTPMGFQEPIVLLTAVHFHFAGFAAPLLALAAGSAFKTESLLSRQIFNVVAAGVLFGPGLLATGFVIGPHAKLAAALLVACSETGLSLFFLSLLSRMRSRAAQVFLAISALSGMSGMVLAGAWAIGEFPLQPFIHLDEMARIHGTANAFGFVLCGLIGWSRAIQGDHHSKGERR